jgi:hypothetical protein
LEVVSKVALFHHCGQAKMIFLYFENSPRRKVKVDSILPSEAAHHRELTKLGTMMFSKVHEGGRTDREDSMVMNSVVVTPSKQLLVENEAKIDPRSGSTETRSLLIHSDHWRSSVDECSDPSDNVPEDYPEMKMDKQCAPSFSEENAKQTPA